MASSSISFSFFPRSISRPSASKSRNARSSTLKKNLPTNPNRRLNLEQSQPSLPPPLSSVRGGEATTYTRLPPKDDFFPPTFGTHLPSSTEIKLSDFSIPEWQKANPGNGEFQPEQDELSDNAEEERFDYGKFGFSDVNSDGESPSVKGERLDELGWDYGKFALYVVSSDDENGDLDYSGEEDESTSFNGKEFGKLGFSREELEDGERIEKEKGVPAVMRCFDRAKIYVRSGNGGNGVMAFHREKYVPLGGPSGGDGGRGGNVYLTVDSSMNSLLPFRKSLHFRAGRGAHGQGDKQTGAKGEDVVVKVPPGTIVRVAGENGGQGEVLLELLNSGEKALLLPGGRGGRGNASFKSGTNKVPKLAENGEEGVEMWVELELKLVADVGIVGAPNAGKSTFLSVVSAARPTIANYPFTTLLPNLGLVSFDYDDTMVMADLPGLLEGAHRGFGLGHEFLRHAERCSVLVHIVDGSSQQPEYEFDAVRLELELFSPELAEKPFIVAYNKMDLPDAHEKWASFQEKLHIRGIEPFCMSAVQRVGTEVVISAAFKLFKNRTEAVKEGVWRGPENLNHVAEMVRKQQTASIHEFQISRDHASNTWHVEGSGLQRFVQMTNWKYIDSDRRFQHVLEACGVYKSLMQLGVKEGDTVVIGEMELVWHDSTKTSGPGNTRRRSTDSVKWPQWT